MSDSLEQALSAPERAESLTLSDPSIADLRELQRLPNLKHLCVRGMPVERWPDEVWKLSRLRVLNAASWEGVIPGSVASLRTLEELDLHCSPACLTKIPESIGTLRGLRSLRLSHLDVSELPRSFYGLRKLEELSLSSIRGRGEEGLRLSAEMARLTRLRRLKVTGVGLANLPDVFDNLTQLDSLSVERNLLAELPKSVGSVKTLRVLDIQECRFTQLPAFLCALPSLAHLAVSGNTLRCLPDYLGSIKTLETLNAAECELSDYPRSLENLTSLNWFTLSGNIFPPEPFAALEAWRERVRGLEIEMPRPGKPKAAKQGPAGVTLSKLVLRTLRQIGFEKNRDKQCKVIDIAEERHKLRGPIKQLLEGFKYPVSFSIPIYDEPRQVEAWPDDEALEEYECIHHAPYVQWATTRSEQKLLVCLADDHPEDPEVFYLDHDDYSEHELSSLGRLSEVLAEAQPVDES